MWLQNKVSFSFFSGCLPIDFALVGFRLVFCELRRHGNAYRKDRQKHTIPGRAARFDVYIAGLGQTVRPNIADKVLRNKYDDYDDD